MKKPAGALFYARYKDLMYLLPAEQVKELMVAFCEYAFDDKNPDVFAGTYTCLGTGKVGN